MKIEYEILFCLGWGGVWWFSSLKLTILFFVFTTKKGKNNVVITAKSGTVDCLG